MFHVYHNVDKFPLQYNQVNNTFYNTKKYNREGDILPHISDCYNGFPLKRSKIFILHINIIFKRALHHVSLQQKLHIIISS